MKRSLYIRTFLRLQFRPRLQERKLDRSRAGSIPNWYGSALGLHGIAWDRSAIRASLGSIARAIQFGIDPVRAPCKRLDRSQTGTDTKWGKPKSKLGLFHNGTFRSPGQKGAKLWFPWKLKKEKQSQFFMWISSYLYRTVCQSCPSEILELL